MATAFHFKLGTFACMAIPDNDKLEPITEMIAADVPPAELSAVRHELGYPSDDLEVGYNCLLVNTGEQRVLVDTGTGRGQLLSQLQASGLEPADIDTIVLTHGDGDHIGGILNEQDQPVFPNARYVLWHAAWRLWTEPDTRSHLVEQYLDLMRKRGVSGDDLDRMAAGRAAYGTRTLPLIKDRVDLVELDTEFLPGFQVIDATGHRTDQVALTITSDGDRLLHVVDAIRHPIQMAHPEWYGALDSFPEETVAARRRLLERAAADKALIFGAHLTFPGLGYVSQQGSSWRWRAFES